MRRLIAGSSAVAFLGLALERTPEPPPLALRAALPVPAVAPAAGPVDGPPPRELLVPEPAPIPRPSPRRASRIAPPPAPSPPDPPPPPPAVSPDAEPGRWRAPAAPVWAIPGAMPEAAPPAAAPTRVARREPDPELAGKLLSRELRERDKTFGLDLSAAARIADALSISVREHAPAPSRAVFVAQLGPGGRVAGIEVSTFTAGSVEAWRAAAHAAERALAGRTFALPGPYAHGATVTVRVTQNLQLPSGRGRTVRHERGELPRRADWRFAPTPSERRPLSLRPIETPIETDLAMPRYQLGDCLTSSGVEVLGPSTSQGAQICGCNVFDVADIGAHRQRVVDVSFETKPIPRPGPRRFADG